MKLFYKVISILTLLLFILALSNCKLIGYGISQGIGQIQIVSDAKPIEDLIMDSLVSDSLKAKLLLVKEIKQYAIDSLGLKPSKNYTTLYNQEGKPVLWVVVASEKYRLQAYEWKFPFLGEVPYKGFFKEEKAEKEARKIANKGYDVHIGTVSAWSTLGFFKDPILSEMLNQSEGMIARLIIHELTHGTIYVKGNSEFNENLATFVGNNGAKQFLISKYGEKSKQYKDYLGELSDIEKFSRHILKGAQLLDSLYDTFSENEGDNLKKTLKKQIIIQILDDIDTIHFYQKHSFYKLKQAKNFPNNAFFVSYLTYDKQQDELTKQFRTTFDSNFKKYLNYLKAKYKDKTL